jgi:transposase
VFTLLAAHDNVRKNSQMQLTREQFEQIAPLLPRQRGNVRLENFQVVNAILYAAANGCKWRALPGCYGHWHTVYMRMSRWAKAGVLDALFEQLQRQRLMHVRIEAVCLDSSIIKVHPDGTGALKKTVRRPSAKAAAAGAPNFIWLPRVRAMCSPGA